MPNCVICNCEVSKGAFNSKDKFELLNHSYICKSCASKIGIKSIWSASVYTAEKAKAKYFELYPDEAPKISNEIDPAEEERLDEEFIARINAIPNCKVGIPGYMKYLRQSLSEDEEVLHVVTGLMRKDSYLEIGSTKYKNAIWIAALTNARIIMVHKRVPVGVDSVSFPLEFIKTVSCKTGLADSVVTIMQGLSCVILENIKNEYGKAFVAKANDAIRNIRKSQVVQAPAATPVSAADELVKWHSLLKQGIITQEEFDAQKEKLLK